VDRLPIADREATARLTVEGSPPSPLEARPLVARATIGGDYLSTLRIPVIRGRVFSSGESAEASRVALINEEAARQFWPGRDPIGARLALDAEAGRETWLQIVGVVGNLRNSDVDQGPVSQVYIPASLHPTRELAVVVKSEAADPLSIVPAIRSLVTQIDRDQPIHDIASMRRVIFDDLAGTYVLAGLLTAVGFIALSLSAAGVYGIIAYSVAQRAREIGVRLALGAPPNAIVRMMVGQGMRPVAIGGAAGLVSGLALAVAIGSAVSEFDARDPLNYVGVILAVALVTLAACYLPARRAASIDPMMSLRQE
jgi:putative ABC transport system permease protein